ncbi:MAG TPA: hypothetical protein PLU39_02680 [Armatimonadota bacterium]|nr:hypothetical protein [Armatimonadota bacterium]HOM83151.1 hypothetical protein [Armatimonadota bacterium]HOQ28885.1 hypothetical protein [Armatimonadota bacterium]HPO74493.1 hypothetical protein [Armatimonadota bacterium]HPT96752.1 hypothetical protein [Armatimonadota bacterium]
MPGGAYKPQARRLPGLWPTSSRYGHVLQEMDDTAARRLDNLFNTKQDETEQDEEGFY